MERSKEVTFPLRMIAWEITRSCNLSCVHCRASAERGPYVNELTTEECFKLLDDIASFSKPVIIFTGGEPLLREDIFTIVEYGRERQLPMVMAPNGTLLTEEKARRLKEVGIRRISISIDGASKESHDQFRQVKGAFEGALRGIEQAKAAGLEFQINTTVTKANLSELPAIQDLALRLGAVAHHLFLLVPTGRAREMKEEEVSGEDYEKTLNWFYEQQEKVPLQLKATCAPQFQRILKQRDKGKGRITSASPPSPDQLRKGCLGGISFCFISHQGQVQPCGYLELNCGNIREKSLKEIWDNSEIFQNLRNFKKYLGKCGRCEYLKVCGGCRARAYEMKGNYLEEEPLCPYQPRKKEKSLNYSYI